jgi:4-aminobutyrate aminotransferase
MHGILMIADEIQTGFGRTGKMFAVEHSGVVPDLLVIAKGFANGMPLSGIVTRKEIMDRGSRGRSESDQIEISIANGVSVNKC